MGFLLFLLFLGSLGAGIAMTVMASAKKDSFAFAGSFFYFMAIPLFALMMSFTQVNAGTVGVVTRNGAVSRILSPGAHFILPFVDSKHEMTTQTLVVKPDEDASTLDLQSVHTQVTLAYHFDPAYMDYIYSKLADASDNSIERKIVIPAVLEAIKASTAKYNAPELVNQRPAVRDQIENYVAARLLPYHILAEQVSITDFRFSPEYEKSIEQKQTAEQDAEKESNILKQVKIQAEQKIAAAEGEAAALKAQKEQITPELLQLRMVEMLKAKWDGHLPESYFGGAAPLPIVEAFRSTKK